MTMPAPSDPDNERRAFGRVELAKRWSVSAKTIDRLLADGRLASFNVGRRRLIPADAVRAFECRGAA